MKRNAPTKERYQFYKKGILKSNKEYYEKNRIKVNEYISKWSIQNSKHIRLLLIKRLGSRCVKCGFTDFRALQLDHINGGGNKESKNYSNAKMKYKAYLKDDNLEDYIQLLCANCNWIKKYVNREVHSKYD